MLATPTARILPRPSDGHGLLPAPSQTEQIFRNGSPTLPASAPLDLRQSATRTRRIRRIQEHASSPDCIKTLSSYAKSNAQATSGRSAMTRDSHPEEISSSGTEEYVESAESPTPIAFRPFPNFSHHAIDMASQKTPTAGLRRNEEDSTHQPGIIPFAGMPHPTLGRVDKVVQEKTAICPLTPVEMDLGSLEMIASFSPMTPVATSKAKAFKTQTATPQSGLRLKTGSVIAMITPEQSCWSRTPYIAGTIMMSHEFLLPMNMMSDMDQLAHFIGATSLVEARIKSDDIVLDEIVDFFGDLGLMDVEPFTRPVIEKSTMQMEGLETPEVGDATEVTEAEEIELVSNRWSGSTERSDARNTLCSIHEVSQADIGKDRFLSDVPNTPGSRSSNASSLSNAWVQRQFPSFTDDLAKNRTSGHSTLPETWTSRHSLPAAAERPPERSSLPAPRHSGNSERERKGGARKAAPLKKSGKISIRRMLASAGSIV